MRVKPDLPMTVAVALAGLGATAIGKDIDFNREVRPILSEHCFQCHGPDERTREAELRLDDGSVVEIPFSGPRYSSGAFGFRSNISI